MNHVDSTDGSKWRDVDRWSTVIVDFMSTRKTVDISSPKCPPLCRPKIDPKWLRIDSNTESISSLLTRNWRQCQVELNFTFIIFSVTPHVNSKSTPIPSRFRVLPLEIDAVVEFTCVFHEPWIDVGLGTSLIRHFFKKKNFESTSIHGRFQIVRIRLTPIGRVLKDRVGQLHATPVDHYYRSQGYIW